ncbi:DUF2550 family protein [Bremerella cremea]|uniref:DUF2550 family protein n=1 Tax=Bremerella cremea TaxID=1031537 RepID=A0A368KT96_9BACT|nr:DUF2550 family protein [Bremerella cremea]
MEPAATWWFTRLGQRSVGPISSSNSIARSTNISPPGISRYSEMNFRWWRLFSPTFQPIKNTLRQKECGLAKVSSVTTRLEPIGLPCTM